MVNKLKRDVLLKSDHFLKRDDLLKRDVMGKRVTALPSHENLVDVGKDFWFNMEQ